MSHCWKVDQFFQVLAACKSCVAGNARFGSCFLNQTSEVLNANSAYQQEMKDFKKKVCGCCSFLQQFFFIFVFIQCRQASQMILGPAGMLGSLGTGIMEMLLTAGQQNLKVQLDRETALQTTGRRQQHLVIHRHIKDQVC